MSDPKDCRVISSHMPGVIISDYTAHYALQAMKDQAAAGAYKNLLADDASFIRAAIAELEKASQ